MKKYKIILIVGIAVALLFCLSACGCTHEWTEANCLVAKTCTLCGKTEGEPTEHNFIDADCDNPKRCSYCDLAEGEPLGHYYIDGYCSECYEKDPNYIDLNNIGFSNLQGINKFIMIDRINESEGFVQNRNGGQVYSEYEFFGNYYTKTKYSVYGGLKKSGTTSHSYSILNNDVISIPNLNGTWTITERIVLDKENNSVWIKFFDEDGKERWLISSNSIDWSRTPVATGGKNDWANAGAMLYLK